LAAIDQAILGTERCLGGMDEISTWARRVESSGQKILKRIQTDRDALAAQVASLRDHTAGLRANLVVK
jgi:hypothetical protein